MRSNMCAGHNREGEPCGNTAGYKTDHKGYGNCKFHAGNTPSGKKHAAHLEAIAAVSTFGLPREIDPHDALLEELHRTAGHVSWLANLIGELEETELKQYQSPEAGGVIERPAIWVEMYARERKHFSEVAAKCISAGIEERRVQIAEQQGVILAQVIRAILEDLDIKIDEKVKTVVRTHLTSARPSLTAIAGGKA